MWKNPAGRAPHVVIKALRGELGLTQARLARRAGMPQSHLAKIETGTVDMRLSTLDKILGAMFCDAVLVPRLRKKPREIRELVRGEPAAPGFGRDRRAEMPVRIADAADTGADLRFWLSRPPEERIAAVEFLRSQYYALAGHKTLPRLAHVVQMRKLHA
ncbi:MAG: helix-turn-helix domain-containing protein [Elusimicrobia bacterium]|nr:helix-turn-helix domain-containing protein [Elusimicrobiota bacterium]